MSLRYPYVNVAVSQPTVALGGRTARPRPLIGVTVLGPAGAASDRGLLDTGADDTVFPERLATQIGIDLSTCPAGTAAGVGGQAVQVRYAPVTLRVTDGVEFREWTAVVGFVSGALNRPLLGFAGFLQFFTATFHGDREEVELAVNPLYPGS